MMKWLKNLDSALFVPLSKDKLPLIRWGETGGIPYRQLISRYPLSSRCMWALNLASVDVVVFDLDVKSNPKVVDEFIGWLRENGWFDVFKLSFRVMTPSGGWHLYLRLPDDYVGSRFRLIDALSGVVSGVDVLSEGLVVIPPSRSKTGVYRISSNSPVYERLEDLPVAPKELLDSLMSPFSGKEVEFRESAPTPLDKRLKSLGLLDASRVESFLRSRGVRFRRRGNDFALCCLYHQDNHPSASIRVREDKIFYYCFRCSQSQNGELFHRFVRDYESWYAGESLSEGRLLTLAEAKRLVVPQQDKGYFGCLLQPGTVSILGGYQKDFKSTLARNLTERLSRGKRFLGLDVAQVSVLVLSYEESLSQYLSRVHWMAMDESRVMIVPREKLEGYFSIQDAKADPLESLRGWIVQSGAKVVIVDTGWNFFSSIAEARRWSVLGNSEVHRIYDELKSIATETDSAILLIWHVRKGANLTDMPKDQITIAMKDALLGVRAMSAGADSLWFMRRKSLSEDGIASVELYCDGRHPPMQFEFEIDSHTGRVLDEPSPIMPEPPEPNDEVPLSDSSVDARTQAHPKTAEHPDNEGENQSYHGIATNGVYPSKKRANNDEYKRLLDQAVKDFSESSSCIIEEDRENAMKNHQKENGLFEPLRFYYLSERRTDSDVLRLEIPQNADRRDKYYVAVSKDSGDARSKQRRSVFGTVLNYAVFGKTPFEGRTMDEVKRVSFDIETSHINPEHGRVRAIGVQYTYKDEKCLDSFVAMDDTDEEEKRILKEFDRYLHETDPEWLIGYNIFKFDLPFLYARAEKLGISLTYLDKHYRKVAKRYRYGSNYLEADVWLSRYSPTRAVVDLYLLVLRSDLESSGRPTNSLYDVYEYYMGEPVLMRGLDKSQMASWTVESVADLVEYDALATSRLADKLLATEFSLSEYIPLPFSYLIYSGQGMRLETLLLADYLSRRRAIRAKYLPKQSYQGAISELVVPTGRYENLGKIDVVSLYPNIIIHYRVHPENDYDARLPELLRDFLALRLQYKKQKDAISQNRQLALKVLINSAYGFMGASNFIFSDSRAAAMITELGRKNLERMRDVLLDFGCRPIELDTDGIIFVRSGREEEVIKALREQTPFEYEYEEYALGLFLGAKNYLLVGKEGHRVIKGASLRSRAESKIGQKLIQNLIDLLIEGGDVRDIFDLMVRLRDEVYQTDDVLMLVRRRKVSEKTKLIDSVKPRVGDTCYEYYSLKYGRQVSSLSLPAIEDIDKSHIVGTLWDILRRFEGFGVVSEFLQTYPTAKSLDQTLLFSLDR